MQPSVRYIPTMPLRYNAIIPYKIKEITFKGIKSGVANAVVFYFDAEVAPGITLV